jgi:hypothetical protein
MPSDGSHVSSLSIHTLRSLYLVAADNPSPHEVGAKLDHIAARKLHPAISTTLSRRLPDFASDIWLIRRLNLEVDVNLSSCDEQLAGAWANQAADSLTQIFENAAESDGVLHFPDRAAYLAHFLRSLADDSAWGKWYFREFAGLRSLPLSAALRAALCRDGRTGLAALLQLPEADVQKVICSLNQQDANLVLEGIANEGADAAAPLLLESLNPALLGLRGMRGSESNDALELYLRVRRESAGGTGTEVKRFVIALVALIRQFERSGAAADLLHVLCRGNASDLYEMAGPTAAERLMPLLGASEKWLHAVVDCQPFAAKEPSRDARHYSFHGGIFLLLPLLDAMPIASATSSWPSLDRTPAAAAVRFLILLKTTGNGTAARMFHDAVVRDLIGIPAEMDAASLSQWQRYLSRRQLFQFQIEIARWQMENTIAARVSPDVFTQRNPRFFACVDELHDSLMFALPDCRSSLALVSKAASDCSARFAPPPPREQGHSQLPDSSIPRADRTALGDDLAFLKLPSALKGTSRSDLTFSVAARTLLRAFSGRLPGFSRSSLEYLHRNFLDIHATLEVEPLDDPPGRCNVLLASPPLHVVLSLAGMNRQTYSLSWSGRKCAIFPG